MTNEWKQLVIQKLEDNRLAGLKPANVEQLRIAVGAKKGGIERTLSETQTSSSYVDQICKVLGISPPLRQLDKNEERDVAALAAFPPEIRRRLIDIGQQLMKK